MNEVQRLVDALAAELGGPVGVDDRSLRAVAYSSHREEIDAVRRDSILSREAPDAVKEWLGSLGVDGAVEPLRVPANADLGMTARVCVPLRFEGMLLGYMWLLDAPRPLSESQLLRARRIGEELSVALYETRLLDGMERERERELVEALTGGGQVAAGALAGSLASASCYAAIAVEVLGEWHALAPEALCAGLASGLEQMRRSLAPRRALVRTAGSEATLLMAADDADEPGRVAATLRETVESHLGEVGDRRTYLGVGEACESPLGLRRSWEQASQALRLARLVPEHGPVALWAALGAYRSILGLLEERDPARYLPRSLQRLLEATDGQALLQTLAVYLDHAGDVRSSAAELFVHRSSLYHRLHRIEQVASVDLRSGEDRLELQLGIRLWRLASGQRQIDGAQGAS